MSLATLGRLLRLAWGQDTPPDPPPSSPAPEISGFPPAFQPGELTPVHRGEYLAWLLGVDGIVAPARAVAPDALLRAADQEIHAKGSPTRLLRRSPAVLPRLIRILRSETYSTAELALQIQQDILLTAEVLRMARSALFARSARDSLDVREAVAILGSTGVEQVIARVVVRPLYRSDSSGLQVRCAERLWEDSERCATACVQLARGEGLDIFDAYVAGLLQNAGWSALLRAFEIRQVEAGLTAVLLAEPRWQQELAQRHELLLSRLIPAWDLTPGLDMLAAGLAVPAMELPLARAVRAAQEQVIQRRLADLAWERQGTAEATARIFLATQPASL